MKFLSTNPFAWFDELLLGKILEPLSWRSQYYWKRDNFYWARIIFLAVMGMLMPQTVISGGQPSPVVMVVFTFFVWWWLGYIRDFAKKVRSAPTAMNPQRSYVIPRCLMITLYAFILCTHGRRDTAIVISMNAATYLSVVLHNYLMACNPMPAKWEPPKKKPVGALAPQLI